MDFISNGLQHVLGLCNLTHGVASIAVLGYASKQLSGLSSSLSTMESIAVFMLIHSFVQVAHYLYNQFGSEDLNNCWITMSKIIARLMCLTSFFLGIAVLSSSPVPSVSSFESNASQQANSTNVSNVLSTLNTFMQASSIYAILHAILYNGQLIQQTCFPNVSLGSGLGSVFSI